MTDTCELQLDLEPEYSTSPVHHFCGKCGRHLKLVEDYTSQHYRIFGCPKYLSYWFNGTDHDMIFLKKRKPPLVYDRDTGAKL